MSEKKGDNKLKPIDIEPKSIDQLKNDKLKAPFRSNQLLYITLSESLKSKYNPSKEYITREEIEKHNKIDDAWIIYKDKVYDITLYLNYHPGGKKILLNQLGKDVTEFVLRLHPWVNVEEILKHSHIGYVK